MTNDSYRSVREAPTADPPGSTHPEWAERFPWLVQGTTGRGSLAEPFDLGLFADASSARRVLDRWAALRSATGLPRAVHALQVHRNAVRFHGSGPPGLHVADPCDGHATADAGVLLTVTVADCVPVFVVDPERRAVAMIHAGWRGAAADILEQGLRLLEERVDSRAADLHVHLGPSICGDCYEVGPEVFEGLGLDTPSGPSPVDLRGALARRAEARGVPHAHITISAECTLCGEGGKFFSHRRGDRERQVGYLGMRP